LRNHPELTDADIMKLIGTISNDRENPRSWSLEFPEYQSGGSGDAWLVLTIELDFIVGRAAHRKPRPTKNRRKA
jgi:hypothetical protein